MPSLVPAGSLSEVVESMAQQNTAMETVPEVASVVGKAGRVESALDPAPIGMIETIVLLKPQDQWRKVPGNGSTNIGRSGSSAAARLLPEERLITKDEILAELRQKTAIPGVLPSWLQPIQTRIVMLQSGFRAMMGVKIYGSDLKEIERLGLQIEQILKDSARGNRCRRRSDRRQALHRVPHRPRKDRPLRREHPRRSGRDRDRHGR